MEKTKGLCLRSTHVRALEEAMMLRCFRVQGLGLPKKYRQPRTDFEEHPGTNRVTEQAIRAAPAAHPKGSRETLNAEAKTISFCERGGLACVLHPPPSNSLP